MAMMGEGCTGPLSKTILEPPLALRMTRFYVFEISNSLLKTQRGQIYSQSFNRYERTKIHENRRKLLLNEPNKRRVDNLF